jgi:hypothetical protein
LTKKVKTNAQKPAHNNKPQVGENSKKTSSAAAVNPELRKKRS